MVSVSGRKREPLPPTKTIAFIGSLHVGRETPASPPPIARCNDHPARRRHGRAASLSSAGMMCGPFLEVFPTGEPGGFRLVGELDGSGAGPLWTFLEPVATCGLGLTFMFDEV